MGNAQMCACQCNNPNQNEELKNEKKFVEPELNKQATPEPQMVAETDEEDLEPKQILSTNTFTPDKNSHILKDEEDFEANFADFSKENLQFSINKNKPKYNRNQPPLEIINEGAHGESISNIDPLSSHKKRDQITKSAYSYSNRGVSPVFELKNYAKNAELIKEESEICKENENLKENKECTPELKAIDCKYENLDANAKQLQKIAENTGRKKSNVSYSKADSEEPSNKLKLNTIGNKLDPQYYGLYSPNLDPDTDFSPGVISNTEEKENTNEFSFNKGKLNESWKNINVYEVVAKSKLLSPSLEDILLQGEVFKYIRIKVNATISQSYSSRFSVLTKSHIKLYRSKEAVLNAQKPLQSFKTLQVVQTGRLSIVNVNYNSFVNAKDKNKEYFYFYILTSTAALIKADTVHTLAKATASNKPSISEKIGLKGLVCRKGAFSSNKSRTSWHIPTLGDLNVLSSIRTGDFTRVDKGDSWINITSPDCYLFACENGVSANRWVSVLNYLIQNN